MSKQTLYKDYSRSAFSYFHNELEKNYSTKRQPHLICRREFWKNVKPGKYTYEEALPFLEQYSKLIENKIKMIVSTKSYMYWIHVYRRIFPGKITENCTELEILNTRRIMEIAFQKYGKTGLCSHIAKLKSITLDKVFNGLYLRQEFLSDYMVLTKSADMLVLTDFGVEELEEIYNIEKLCFELHKINRTYRILGKGALLNYSERNTWDTISISPDISFLIESFDKRLDNNAICSSYLGVYYTDKEKITDKAPCIFPIYNVSNITFSDYATLLKDTYDLEIESLINDQPNFVFMEFDIFNFYKQHKDVSDFFYNTNKVSFELLLIIIYHFFLQIFSKFENPGKLFNFFFRAYSIYTKTKLISSIKSDTKRIEKLLDMPDKTYTNKEIEAALSYLCFDESKRFLLDLNYCSLYYPFYNLDHELLIDFSWIYRTFLTFFFRLKMPDQNFKGTILEKSLVTTPSILPTKSIKASDKTEHQMDYSFIKDKVLYILECKSVSMSVDYEKGNKEAIERRTEEVVNRSLKECDEKVQWLINHKEIIKQYAPDAEFIVPIGISAFTEYIPSKSHYYWLNDELPRVLTPKEISELRKEDIDIKYNKYKID